MDRAGCPTLDPEILNRNLAALTERRPDLARALGERPARSTDPPSLDRTRDGRLNFRLNGPDGRTAWFGRTSIPGVRAAAVLERFDAGHGNVLLPGVGEGSEIELLLARLGAHRAVFVWEASLDAIRWVLHLHDVAEAVRRDRLIFLHCSIDELTDQLVTWLEGHPGHLCPERILMWPWQALHDLAPCRSAVEAAYREIEGRRHAAMKNLQSRLNATRSGGSVLSDTPGVAVMSIHARAETWVFSDALVGAASELGWRAIDVAIRAPGDVHALARSSRLAEADAGSLDLAILLNIGRHQLGGILPAKLPAVAWLTDPAAVPGALAPQPDPADLIAVANSRMADQVIQQGLDRNRIVVVPPPCLTDTAWNDPDAKSGTDAQPSTDIAIFADASPTDPKSFEHQTSTHERIWNTALDLLREQIDAFTDEQGPRMLVQAERRVGARVDSDAIRRSMLEVLCTRVADTLLIQSITQILINNGFTITIHGAGWPENTGARIQKRPLTPADMHTALNAAGLAVHASAGGHVGLGTLLAAGSGTPLLARAHPRDRKPGGLAALLEPGPEVTLFRQINDLPDLIRSLLNDSSARRSQGRAARERCLRDHLPARRLEALKAAANSYFTRAGS